MTVAELIKELQALPGDMKVQVLDSERGDPEDIEDGFESMINGEFIQDDENGQIAVLVIW